MKRLLSFILVFLALAAPGKTRDHIAVDVSGTITQRTGALTDTPFLFNGAYGVVADSNGLLYMQARYYNPQIRRFINADPSGFSGGMHFYAFAGATPVLVHNTNPGERLYIVYQAPLRSGKIYTGPTRWEARKIRLVRQKYCNIVFRADTIVE